MRNAAEHGDALCELVDRAQAPTLVVNCARLTLLESRGLAMMQRVHRRGCERGTEVVWRGLRPLHRRVLEITGLDTVLFLDGSPDDEDLGRRTSDASGPGAS